MLITLMTNIKHKKFSVLKITNLGVLLFTCMEYGVSFVLFITLYSSTNLLSFQLMLGGRTKIRLAQNLRSTKIIGNQDKCYFNNFFAFYFAFIFLF